MSGKFHLFLHFYERCFLPQTSFKNLLNQTGPALDQLPEELLPALGKFLYIGRDGAEQGEINREGVVIFVTF